jgi:hypothetical protein
LAPAFGSAVLLVPVLGWAQGSDPVAARAQLREGYTLKQQGKCKDAVPHLQESVRLDRQPKSLINLGECEQKLGQLAAAQSHFLEARDLARSGGDATLRNIAGKKLEEVEKKMPKLGIELGKDAPAGTVVLRDGVEVGAVSLRIELPIDVGRHVVVARGGGFERQYEVTLAEGESKQIEVTPIGGKALAGAAKSVEKTADQPNTAPTPPGDTKPTSSFRVEGPQGDRVDEGEGGATQRTIGYVAIGAGVIGLGVGAFFGATFLRRQNDLEDCNTTLTCDDATWNDTRQRAVNARTYTAIGLAGGGVLAATGLILLVTAPKSSPTGWTVAPMVGRDGTGVWVDGRF